MVAVAVEQLGPVRARRVPVDKHGVGVSRHPFCDHFVVRFLPGAGDCNVNEYDPIYARECPHDLVELPLGEGAVVTKVDDYHVPQLPRGPTGLQDVGSGIDLKTDLRVNHRKPPYVFLQPSDGAEHNRVADGAHGTSKLGRTGAPAIPGLLRAPGLSFVPGAVVRRLLVDFLFERWPVLPGTVYPGCGGRVMRLFHCMYGLHEGEVGGFRRRFSLGHGYAEQRAGGQDGHEGPGPLETEPPAQRSSRLAERPPGPSQGAAAYRRLDVAVGEIRQDDRRGQAQG